MQLVASRKSLSLLSSILLATSLATFPGLSHAEEDPYEFFDVAVSDSEFGNLNGNGFDLEGSFKPSRNFYLTYGYSSTNLARPPEGNNTGTEVDFDINDLNFGIFAVNDVNETLDFQYGVELIHRSVDITLPAWLQSESDLGFSGIFNFRIWPSPNTEVRVGAHPYILDNVSDIRYELACMYRFDGFSLFIEREEEPGLKRTLLGVRFAL